MGLSISKVYIYTVDLFSGKLSADSSNVVQLVKAQYEAITSSIEMKDNATGSVKVRKTLILFSIKLCCTKGIMPFLFLVECFLKCIFFSILCVLTS
jgi:hypothetical protein